MNAQEIQKDAEARMEKALDVFRNDLKSARTGRASPQMLDALRVDNYGTMSPIRDVASVTCPDAATIVIKPYTADTLKEIEKAIRSSDLGLAPNNDGKVIRLSIPAMSGDQRKKIVAQVKKSAEAAKVSCRNIRRDAMEHLKKLEKEHGISEDEHKRHGTEVQKATDDHIKRIDDTLHSKEQEIMQV